MSAPEGNENGLKLKDPELRQKAYQKYCEWIARGKSSRSFTFVDANVMCTGQTIESYIRNNPIEFPAIHKEIAKAKGYAYWEQIVEDSASGINQNANTASLQMVMRNKFDWDRNDKSQQENSDFSKKLADLSAFFDKMGPLQNT